MWLAEMRPQPTKAKRMGRLEMGRFKAAAIKLSGGTPGATVGFMQQAILRLRLKFKQKQQVEDERHHSPS
jgi:hypothetical protein